MGKLPTFLVIGAGKSGTSSLYEYLKHHPQVFMSEPKEARFFCCEGEALKRCFNAPNHPFRAITRLEDYRKLFAQASDEKAVGEASPQYLPWPTAAERIKALLPDVKLIAILRHPVERAFSSYVYRLTLGLDRGSFASVIQDDLSGNRDDWRSGRVVHGGFYHQHLRRYYDRFPQSQIKVFLYEDLRDDATGLRQELYRFVGVDDAFAPLMAAHRNKTASAVPRRFVGRRILRFIRALPNGVRSRIAPLVFKTAPVLSGSDRSNLLSIYRSDTSALGSLIGRDISSWLE